VLLQCGMTAIPDPARSDRFVRAAWAAADANRMALAVHESGHACMALALGLEVTRLDLELCRTRRRDDQNGRWAESVTAFAGSLAEMRHARYTRARNRS
jgi:hypothetical protein